MTQSLAACKMQCDMMHTLAFAPHTRQAAPCLPDARAITRYIHMGVTQQKISEHHVTEWPFAPPNAQYLPSVNLNFCATQPITYTRRAYTSVSSVVRLCCECHAHSSPASSSRTAAETCGKPSRHTSPGHTRGAHNSVSSVVRLRAVSVAHSSPADS